MPFLKYTAPPDAATQRLIEQNMLLRKKVRVEALMKLGREQRAAEGRGVWVRDYCRGGVRSG